MAVPTTLRVPIGNRLLASLPPKEHEVLLPHLERVHLPLDTMLYQAGDRIQHVYFPTSGMVSLLSTTEDGEAVEVAMVGNDGMLDVACLLRVNITPYQSAIQIAADALRIRADVVRREFDRGGHLQDVLLRYTHALLTHISQSAVCNRYHKMDSRLCRWLLLAPRRVFWRWVLPGPLRAFPALLRRKSVLQCSSNPAVWILSYLYAVPPENLHQMDRLPAFQHIAVEVHL